MSAGPKITKLRKREPLILDAIPENLLREPIEYIFADHYRLRQVIATMDQFLAEGIFALFSADDSAGENAADIATIRAYLVDELPLHIADEEEDLFPALARRCSGDDETKQILDTLRQEHEDDFALLPPITEGLDSFLDGRAMAEWERFETSVARFVETQRRHIIWENNIVLPLARRRLDDDDMATIGHNIAARRDIEYPA